MNRIAFRAAYSAARRQIRVLMYRGVNEVCISGSIYLISNYDSYNANLSVRDAAKWTYSPAEFADRLIGGNARFPADVRRGWLATARELGPVSLPR